VFRSGGPGGVLTLVIQNTAPAAETLTNLRFRQYLVRDSSRTNCTNLVFLFRSLRSICAAKRRQAPLDEEDRARKRKDSIPLVLGFRSLHGFDPARVSNPDHFTVFYSIFLVIRIYLTIRGGNSPQQHESTNFHKNFLNRSVGNALLAGNVQGVDLDHWRSATFAPVSCSRQFKNELY